MLRKRTFALEFFLSCLWLFGLLLKTEHMGKPWIKTHTPRSRGGDVCRHVRAPRRREREGERVPRALLAARGVVGWAVLHPLVAPRRRGPRDDVCVAF